MGIWTSFSTFGELLPYRTLVDEPYADFKDATGHYTVNDPASLASTPRGGMLDIARSGMCDLFRVYVDDGDGRNASVYLSREQLARLRDGVAGELEDDRHG